MNGMMALCVLRTAAAEMWEKKQKNKVNPDFPGAWKKLLKDDRGRKKSIAKYTREKFPHLGITTCSRECIISGRKPRCCRIN